MSMSKLYVGNLSYKATDEGLFELFSQAGTVASAKIIVDKTSGRSKGFAFVEMNSQEEAEAAKEKFNNFTYMDRPLVVNDAKPQERKNPRERKRSNP